MSKISSPLSYRDLIFAATAATGILLLWEMLIQDIVHRIIYGTDSPLTTSERIFDSVGVVMAVIISALVVAALRTRSERIRAMARPSEVRSARAEKIAGLGQWEINLGSGANWWSDTIDDGGIIESFSSWVKTIKSTTNPILIDIRHLKIRFRCQVVAKLMVGGKMARCFPFTSI